MFSLNRINKINMLLIFFLLSTGCSKNLSSIDPAEDNVVLNVKYKTEYVTLTKENNTQEKNLKITVDLSETKLFGNYSLVNYFVDWEARVGGSIPEVDESNETGIFIYYLNINRPELEDRSFGIKPGVRYLNNNGEEDITFNSRTVSATSTLPIPVIELTKIVSGENLEISLDATKSRGGETPEGQQAEIVSYNITWGDEGEVDLAYIGEEYPDGLATHNYELNSGYYVLTLTVRDEFDGFNKEQVLISTDITSPIAVVNISSQQLINDAFEVEVNSNGTQAGTLDNELLEISNFTINWGDGTPEETNSTGQFTHDYPASENEYTISLTVENELNQTDTTTKVIQISEADNSQTETEPSGSEPPEAVIVVTDEGYNGVDYYDVSLTLINSTDDTGIESFIVDWGTNDPVSGDRYQSSGTDISISVSSGPIFEANTGSYTITATVTDEDGNTDSATYELDTTVD